MSKMNYNFKEIEEKWQKTWREEKTFKAEVDTSKKKFYCLDIPLSFGKNPHGAC
jgi:leucyl-tRNA synthetase